MEEKDRIMNQRIDTSERDFAYEADAEKARRKMEERERIMNQPNDTTAEDLLLNDELERVRKKLENQESMYKDKDEPYKTR